MHDLSLKTVREFERSFELGQLPIDEVRETLMRWILAEKNRELRCEDGAIDAAITLLDRITS